MSAHRNPDPIIDIAAAFQLSAPPRDAKAFGNGHINDTYLVTLEDRSALVIQRLNHVVFKNPEAVMKNVWRVTKHLQQKQDPTGLQMLPTLAGKCFHIDTNGNYWRCFPFIENSVSYDIIPNNEIAYEGARAIGQFQRLLHDFPAPPLAETIPDFHNTPKRFQRLINVSKNAPANRTQSARDAIDAIWERKAAVQVLQDLCDQGQIPERITHNDTKLNNVLFDAESGKSLCVVDLDTVMPGLSLVDYGDMIRTGAQTSPEDEPDPSNVSLSLPLADALTRGYLSTAISMLTDVEIKHLWHATHVITLEVAIRFLTDFLEGDCYFKTTHPTHNLDRTQAQLRFVELLEINRDALVSDINQAVVEARSTAQAEQRLAASHPKARDQNRSPRN